MERSDRNRGAVYLGVVILVVVMQRGVTAQNAEVVADAVATQKDESVVVLQDGGVLVGELTHSGDRYLLKRSGNEIQIAEAKVLLVAPSLEAAYEQRRRRLSAPTADSHLALAEWCLRYRLVDQAARELADARQLETRHPRLALLERRLVMASRQPPNRAPARPASGPEAAVNKQSQMLPTTISGLSSAAIELFTRRVQPVLVNNCTSSGCHERGGRQRFQLDRAILHGMANRRSTMQNLAATLALVDRERPQLSPLLTVPREAHGGAEAPIFGPREEQAFAHLVDWVALVTNATKAEPEEEGAAEALVAGEQSALARWTSPILRIPVQPKLSSSATEEIQRASFDEPAAATEAQQLRYGARLHRWQPRDPFDAETFNRQQHQRQESAAAPAVDTSEENN